ncbi:class I SAM-dependent methyltransferase [Sulfolobus sp. E11-6]|uniref:class I SAM-dependent methyltransferase n=1 Tax=Sulfolobus sp. E11-6 TaxID=2663020 RepID=UPI0012956BD5|nr:class I SAM-dependent methyltransferase [Sulfolobus sp. E11-6]QGA69239.1 methyltransferase domain-containing protein [Sulfolobus sp. E11-6]
MHHHHGHYYPPEDFRRTFERPEEFLPEVFEGKKGVIVDYGCGNGFYAKYLLEYATKLYCIDINVIALEEVKKKFKSVITLTSPKEIPDNIVDFVLFANSFHDMDDKHDVVNEVKRILKNDGRVIIIDWKKENTGFGPPLSIRMDEKDYMKWFSDFIVEKRFTPTPYHFGLILKRKTS